MTGRPQPHIQPLDGDEHYELVQAGRLRFVTEHICSRVAFGRLIMRSLLVADVDGRFHLSERALDILEARSADLCGCVEGSAEEDELSMIAEALDIHRPSA